MDLVNFLKYSQSGRYKYRLEDYSGAIEDFNKAFELGAFEENYLVRGLAKDKISDYRGAIEDFDKAIEINPNQDVTMYGYPNQYMSDKGDSRQITDWTHLYNPADNTKMINPFYVKRNPISQLLKSHEINLSEDIIKLGYIHILHKGAFYHRGIAKSQLSDFRGAIEDFNKAIEISRYQDEFYCERGIAKSKLSDFTGAIEDFNKAIEINSDSEKAKYYLVIATNSHGIK